jgi:hypothetical protein
LKNKRHKIILLTVAFLLFIPLIAMQFTEEVNWNPLDFVAAGVLLLCTGLVLDIVLRKIKNVRYRIIISAALILVLLLVWAELAVGIFGTPLAGN